MFHLFNLFCRRKNPLPKRMKCEMSAEKIIMFIRKGLAGSTSEELLVSRLGAP